MHDLELEPHDRVLLLSLLSPEDIRALAVRLPEGIVVGMGSDDEVREARRALADLDNVMFVPAPEPGAGIPWRDEFFTRVVAPAHREVEPEMLRVLAPDGCVVLAGGSVVRRS